MLLETNLSSNALYRLPQSQATDPLVAELVRWQRHSIVSSFDQAVFANR
jgi:hypothetical protein